MSLKSYKLVANVIETKGMGVLFLGSGKSSLSVFSVMKYEDVYLVADDYTYIITQKFSYPILGLDLLNLYATATPKIPIGKIRNNILVLAPSDQYEQMYQQKEMFLKDIFNIENTESDEIRKSSYYIDTIAQRVAHKNFSEIKYVFFLLNETDPGIILDFINRFNYEYKINDLNKQRMIRDLIRELYNKLKEKKIISINELYNDNQKKIILRFLRIFDNRGDNWLDFLEYNDKIKLYLVPFYPNLMNKVNLIYEIIKNIKPISILDPKEKFI